ncbi:MAG TPA: cation:proton antiporter subunit C [Fusibacter sp.]|nr:cation:proton antiporter subunit C [Fusibacter sp.]
MIEKYISGETISLILFFIGVYGICARRNIIKTIVSLSIMQAAIVLFFVTTGDEAIHAPIGTESFLTNNIKTLADPVPQALMITAIVIGISVTALCLTMFISLFHKYGTTNWTKVKRKRGEHL